MFTSYEVRWFFSEAPPMLRDWFGRRGLAFHPDSIPLRCDFYLRQHRRKDINIKLREGNMEVKERLKNLGIRNFSALWSGRMELWRKWSFRLAATREGGTDEVLAITRQLHPGDWIPLYKERLLVLFEIQEEGRVVLMDQPVIIKEGCGVELTRVEVHGKTHFTLALEAFSATGYGKRNLLSVVDVLLAEIPALQLSSEESMSYPAFLGKL